MLRKVKANNYFLLLYLGNGNTTPVYLYLILDLNYIKHVFTTSYSLYQGMVEITSSYCMSGFGSHPMEVASVLNSTDWCSEMMCLVFNVLSRCLTLVIPANLEIRKIWKK